MPTSGTRLCSHTAPTTVFWRLPESYYLMRLTLATLVLAMLFWAVEAFAQNPCALEYAGPEPCTFPPPPEFPSVYHGDDPTYDPYEDFNTLPYERQRPVIPQKVEPMPVPTPFAPSPDSPIVGGRDDVTCTHYEHLGVTQCW